MTSLPPAGLQIIDLKLNPCDAVRQAAQLLVDCFAHISPPPWPSLKEALAEVGESLVRGRISRVALDETSTVIGWVGAVPGYDGRVWEVHPLVVHPQHQGQGIGRALIQDLEALAARNGVSTLWLGTDDEDERTSLGGVDLYPDPLAHLARMRNLRGHPVGFYQSLGFVVAGVLPDANGFGKPDIFLAKRVAPPDPAPDPRTVS
jgi:aminoglycoside 6'-N-acetyltransferase I